MDALEEYGDMIETMFDLHGGLFTVSMSEYTMLPATFLELWREFKLEVRRHAKSRH